MNFARNYANLLNFVKVMLKILALLFFPDTVYIAHGVNLSQWAFSVTGVKA